MKNGHIKFVVIVFMFVGAFPINPEPLKSSIVGLWKKVGVNCRKDGRCSQPGSIMSLYYNITADGKFFEGPNESVRNGNGICYRYQFSRDTLRLALCDASDDNDSNWLQAITIEYRVVFLDKDTILQVDNGSAMKLKRIR